MSFKEVYTTLRCHETPLVKDMNNEWFPIITEKTIYEKRDIILITLLWDYISEETQDKIKALQKINPNYDKKEVIKFILGEVIKNYAS